MTQNNCIVIGLTGGIATGKSTVSKMLINRGYKVIDADQISREVVEIGKPAYKDIVETFGLRILLEDKNLNRKKLGRLIFNNSKFRDILNNIIHPRVFNKIAEALEEGCKNNNIIFIDIPLLFEVHNQLNAYNISFNEIWMVYTNEEAQLKRLMERDNIGKEEAMSKINSQLSVDEKRQKSTKTLFNNSDLKELERNLDIMLSELVG